MKKLILGMIFGGACFAQAPPYRYTPNFWAGASAPLNCTNGDMFFSIITYIMQSCNAGTWANLNFSVAAPGVTGNLLYNNGGAVGAASALNTNGTDFQTNTLNSATLINLVPNGTSATNALIGYNASDKNNAYFLRMGITGAQAQFNLNSTGTPTTPVTSMLIGSGGADLANIFFNFGGTKATITSTGIGKFQELNTNTNCASGASPAVCGSASAGGVAIPTGVNPTLVVQSTAITATSQIIITNDSTLGTNLSVTCNTTAATEAILPFVTARSAGTSFTLTFNGTISTNPLCVNYMIVN